MLVVGLLRFDSPLVAIRVLWDMVFKLFLGVGCVWNIKFKYVKNSNKKKVYLLPYVLVIKGLYLIGCDYDLIPNNWGPQVLEFGGLNVWPVDFYNSDLK